ncbi:MAG: hypothetical protein GX847_00120 [Clostridiales bacterium]|nr:hypothetical protein [Clostridiales bacterium]
MKKNVIFVFCLILIAGFLAGCKASPEPAPSPSESSSGSPSPSPSTSASPSAAPSGSPGSAKIGLAVITSLARSADAGEKDGLAQVDSTVAAVSVNSEGKILKCVIDAVQAQINFDDKGQLKTPLTTTFKTKNELGEEYGMKKASGIGREWSEQAEAFSSYVEGMTVDEVKDIKVDEQNYPTQTDLKGSVTISVGGYIEAIEKAVSTAQEGSAAESDRLSLGIVSDMGKSAGASGDKQGLAQVYSTYAAVTQDAGGKITGCVFDASQSNVNFDVKGKTTSDLSEKPQTKNEMGESYGMKEASGIGKEWNEQASEFAKYVTGKTAVEITGIAIDDKGYPVSTDIKSSVTISIGGFLTALTKAVAPS